MQKTIFIVICLSGFFLNPIHTHAQEEPREINIEESAEVYLEQYSDEFQEKFFEALKQKGIENYDKAINLLLECKRLDAANSVVDHELAKAYFEDKKYISAQEYAREAVLANPENLWYLNTLVLILQKQGGSINDISSKIPLDNRKLKENLATIYFKSENYKAALNVVNDMTASPFSKVLSAKIKDSIKRQEDLNEGHGISVVDEDNTDPLQDYKLQIEGLIQNNSIPVLENVSAEALENYPSQPFFYYARGYALNKTGKHSAAIEILEAALDYMLDDTTLANKIYKELGGAYTALNNTSKANTYLRKIKPGF